MGCCLPRKILLSDSEEYREGKLKRTQNREGSEKEPETVRSTIEKGRYNLINYLLHKGSACK